MFIKWTAAFRSFKLPKSPSHLKNLIIYLKDSDIERLSLSPPFIYYIIYTPPYFLAQREKKGLFNNKSHKAEYFVNGFPDERFRKSKDEKILIRLDKKIWRSLQKILFFTFVNS